ncbi:MAG TPA: endo alpha-1,4 polygalactosaminidase [Crenotrichaceae bacterium]|nr:endo alpha-1,4 polygalactosaminidase [Crenotrichaceae bacterium]
MRFNKNYVVFITVQTTLGQRYLYYTQASVNKGIRGKKGNFIHHGLGRISRNGSWQTITRNLLEDLQEFEPDNQILSVNGFLIRGNGRIDNITLSGNQKTAGNWYHPTQLTSWQLQLQGAVNTNHDADLYDVDLFDTSTALIQQLHASAKKVVCYFSAGSYEKWRTDADQFEAADLGKPLDGWPGERWLDVRSDNVREIMRNRLDLAVQKGCDGVDPDNMDGYTNNPGFSFTAKDQLAYNKLIASEAHSRNLAVGLKNDLDQVKELASVYDFAVNEQCFQYNECDLLTPFIALGKAVLNVEYKQRYVDDSAARNKLCSNAGNRQFSTLILPLQLNDAYRLSCL